MNYVVKYIEINWLSVADGALEDHCDENVRNEMN